MGENTMDTPENVARLLRKLENRDPGVRVLAQEKLMEMGEKAVSLLVDFLNSSDQVLCKLAIHALGFLGSRKAVSHLIEALKDSDFFIASAAAQSLREITGQDHGFSYEAWQTWYGTG